MTVEAEQVAYLSGRSDGPTLLPTQRDRLDRLKFHLESEATWVGERPDARSRLLAAAGQEPAPAPPSLEAHHAPIDLASRRQERLVAVPDRTVEDRARETDSVADGGRLSRLARLRSSGALVGVAAAAAAIGFGSAALLGGPSTATTVATYELAATPLDPDATGAIDIKPTPAGVEIELALAGLDHTGSAALGDGVYYAAWLMSDDDVVPLGSFHWRSGDVPIVLWSGVDDPAYNRFTVTRQVEGDNGVRSDQVVLAGQVPSLTG